MADPLPRLRQHPRRRDEERTAGETAGLTGERALAQARGPVHGGVRDDERLNTPPQGGGADGVEGIERHVRGDLQQDRRPGAGRVAGRDDAGQKLVEEGFPLQIAQARRVRRGHVHGDEGDMRHQRRRAGGVVGEAVGRVLVRPDVDPDEARSPGPRLQPRGDHVQPLAVEAEAVDHRPVGGQPEDAGLGIARLRPGHDAADLHEAEAEPEQGIRHPRALVEPAARPTGFGKRRPRTSTARQGSSGAGEPAGSAARARIVRSWARSASSRCSRGRTRGKAASIIAGGSPPEAVAPIRAEGHLLDRHHRRQRQVAVEMREQVAAARGFVAQGLAQPVALDARRGAGRPARRSGGRRSRPPARRWRNG